MDMALWLFFMSSLCPSPNNISLPSWPEEPIQTWLLQWFNNAEKEQYNLCSFIVTLLWYNYRKNREPASLVLSTRGSGLSRGGWAPSGFSVTKADAQFETSCLLLSGFTAVFQTQTWSLNLLGGSSWGTLSTLVVYQDTVWRLEEIDIWIQLNLEQ